MRMVLLTSTLFLGTSGAGFAQYSGPSEAGGAGSDGYANADIQAILDNPQDDENVVLEGMLVRKIGDELYILSDGTSEIGVEIDDDDFPNGEVSATTRVRVEGEVDTHRSRETDIDAERVTIID